VVALAGTGRNNHVPCNRGAAHKPNQRSQSASLIQVKYAMPRLLKQQSLFGCSQILQTKRGSRGVPRAFEVGKECHAETRRSSAQHQPGVNLCRLQISKYLASVALKPQTAKPPGCESHSIGRVVELAAEGNQPDQEKHSVGAVTLKLLF
jgi:hypothetical protein